MKKLLKDYDLKQDEEYFDLCYNCLINGNYSATKDLFLRMRREDRKRCYKYFDGFYDYPTYDQQRNLNYFFNLI